MVEMESWSHLLRHSQVLSGEADIQNSLSRTQPLSTHAGQMRYLKKKLTWATGLTLTPIGLERVFQRNTQGADSSLAAKMSKFPPRVPNNGRTDSVRNDIEELSYAGKIFLQLPKDSHREGSIVTLSPETRIC